MDDPALLLRLHLVHEGHRRARKLQTIVCDAQRRGLWRNGGSAIDDEIVNVMVIAQLAGAGAERKHPSVLRPPSLDDQADGVRHALVPHGEPIGAVLHEDVDKVKKFIKLSEMVVE